MIGTAKDNDRMGAGIVDYEWYSSIDGVLGNEKTTHDVCEYAQPWPAQYHVQRPGRRRQLVDPEVVLPPGGGEPRAHIPPARTSLRGCPQRQRTGFRRCSLPT